MTGHMNVPVFIPHLGCPHNCAFCNQRAVTSKVAAPSPESVAFSIARAMESRAGRLAEIAFFGGSFTGLSFEEQDAYLAAAAPFVASGAASGIRLSTRPDFIDDAVLDFLKKRHVVHIELGAQSMNDAVLLASGRGHTAADTVRAAERIKAHGFVLGLQMMTGLPESTPEREEDTARQFAALGAREARIYPTVVFRGTALYDKMLAGTYVPMTVEEAVSSAATALSIFSESGVHVLRIGLQETETLGGEIAGGAYHPAMGELVRARLYRNRMEDVLKRAHAKKYLVHYPKNAASQVIGHKRENMIYLEKTYGISLSAVPGDTFYMEAIQ